jgi:crotonobetainyl-CoA:carnitine CoA-transferase CaiB-like acyl-CoA transferase
MGVNASTSTTVSKAAGTAAKGAQTANFLVMVAEAGGQLALGAYNNNQLRKLEETLNLMTLAQQEEFAQEMARTNESTAQLRLMLDTYQKAKELELNQGSNRIRNFALVMIGLGIVSIGIILAIRKK